MGECHRIGLVITDDGRRFRIFEVVRNFFCGEASIHRNHAGPNSECGVHGFEQLGTVAHEEPDTIPKTHPLSPKGGAESIGSLIKLGVGTNDVSLRDRRCIRRSTGGIQEHLSDVHEVNRTHSRTPRWSISNRGQSGRIRPISRVPRRHDKTPCRE